LPSSASLFAEKLKLIENEQVLFHVSGNFANWNQKQMLSNSKKEAEQCFAVLHKFMTLPRKEISSEKKSKSSDSIFEDDPLMGTEDVILFDSDDETILGEIKIKSDTDNKEYENGYCPITGEKYVKIETGNGYYCSTHGKEDSKKLRLNNKYLIDALKPYGAVDITIWNNKLRGLLEVKDSVKLKWWQDFIREYMAARVKQVGQLKKAGSEINQDFMSFIDSWKVSASPTKKRIKLQADFKEPKLILAEIANLTAFYADYITPGLQEQRDMAYKKACYAMRRIVLGAIEMYNLDHEEKMHEIDLEKLIGKGYLKNTKRGYKCPLGGAYSFDVKNSEVNCSKCSK
jgi:competence protein ComGC